MSSIKKLWINPIISKLTTNFNFNSPIHSLPQPKPSYLPPTLKSLPNLRFHHFPHHIFNNHLPLIFALTILSSHQALALSLGANSKLCAVSASSTITNSGFTVLISGLCLSPGTAVTGFPPWRRHIHRNRLRNCHCLPSRSRHNLRSMHWLKADDCLFRRSFGWPHAWSNDLQLRYDGDLGR